MTSFSDSSLAIIGGAGHAGQPLIQAALQAGHPVRALLRHPAAFPLKHEQLTVVPGDARDPAALRRLLTGSTALLSTLGHPRGEAAPIFSAVTSQLLPLLRELGIGRYLTVTTLYATGQPQPDPATQAAAAYMQQHFPALLSDRQRELDLLAASPLNWTVLRLPRLVPGSATGHVGTSLLHLPGPQLTTPDLAQFLQQQLGSPQFSRQAPFVANVPAPVATGS